MIIALDTDVEYYPDFQIPGFPSFSNDTFDANSTQNLQLYSKHYFYIFFLI